MFFTDENITHEYALANRHPDADILKTIPDPVYFVEIINIGTNVVCESNEITISGIHVGISVTVEDGQSSVNGSPWIDYATLAHSGDRIKVRLRSSGNPGQLAKATVNMGGSVATFLVRTAAR